MSKLRKVLENLKIILECKNSKSSNENANEN